MTQGPTGPRGALDQLMSPPPDRRVSVNSFGARRGVNPEERPVMLPEDAGRHIVDFFKSASKTRDGLQISCPYCGAAMVVRARSRDDRAFLGCSKYPSCSGSWDVPDAAQEEAKNWERQLMTSQHTAARLPHRTDVDAEALADAAYTGMPPGRTESIRGGEAMRYEPSVEATFGKKKGKVMEKESAKQDASDVPASGVMDRLKRSAKKAPYRMARIRALTNGKRALLAAVKPRVQPAAYDIVEAFLNSDAGEGAVIGLLGLAGPLTPKLGKNKHVQALCEEFLDEGVAKGFNQVLSLVATIVEPALMSAVAEMPGVEEIADKVVPKRRKKRVATPSETRVAREAADEEPEETEVRPRNALRSIASR